MQRTPTTDPAPETPPEEQEQQPVADVSDDEPYENGKGDGHHRAGIPRPVARRLKQCQEALKWTDQRMVIEQHRDALRLIVGVDRLVVHHDVTAKARPQYAPYFAYRAGRRPPMQDECVPGLGQLGNDFIWAHRSASPARTARRPRRGGRANAAHPPAVGPGSPGVPRL